jgi:hypothetical protein
MVHAVCLFTGNLELGSNFSVLSSSIVLLMGLLELTPVKSRREDEQVSSL